MSSRIICFCGGCQRNPYLTTIYLNIGPAAGARAYLEAPPPGVVLCANRLGSRIEVESAVTHELVHAYDYLVAGMQLLDCRSLAYRYLLQQVSTVGVRTHSAPKGTRFSTSV